MLFVLGLGAWLVFMVTAIANGAFREKTLIPRFGKQVGHWISTAMLCVLLVLEIVVFLAIAGDGESDGELLTLGAMWLLLTLAFEFGSDTGSPGSRGVSCWRTTTCCRAGCGRRYFW